MDLTLVGKFLGVRPDIDVLRNMVKREWAVHGQVDIDLMMNGFFSFGFTFKEDLIMLVCGGPWSFGNSTLMIKTWEPNIYLSDAFFLTTMVWVRLAGLPLEFGMKTTLRG